MTFFSHSTYAASGLAEYYPIKQVNTEWCWAAVAQMMGTGYNNGSGPDQWDIVYEIYGNYLNVACDGYECEDAIEFASDVNVKFWGSHKGYDNGCDFIDDNAPYVLILDGSSLTSSIDHAIYVFGYYYTSSSNQKIYYTDPDPDKGYTTLKNWEDVRYNVEASFYKWSLF